MSLIYYKRKRETIHMSLQSNKRARRNLLLHAGKTSTKNQNTIRKKGKNCWLQQVSVSLFWFLYLFWQVSADAATIWVPDRQQPKKLFPWTLLRTTARKHPQILRTRIPPMLQYLLLFLWHSVLSATALLAQMKLLIMIPAFKCLLWKLRCRLFPAECKRYFLHRWSDYCEFWGNTHRFWWTGGQNICV